ncbi:MAG: hypothetical protein KatS3mg105_2137 [Gemmatales bacterium]|nr:MAG: hypothetical protein KatS3mg105_2137 [Gemmatales bacterium]
MKNTRNYLLDKRKLEDDLNSLPERARCAFAASIAERMLPIYLRCSSVGEGRVAIPFFKTRTRSKSKRFASFVKLHRLKKELSGYGNGRGRMRTDGWRLRPSVVKKLKRREKPVPYRKPNPVNACP